jgi:acetyltransferase
MEENPIVVLPDLGAVTIRPLAREDRAAYLAFTARLSPDDVRLRFFRPIPRLDRTMLRALLEIDHDRQEAFVAVDATGAILGVARIVESEIAIIVRSDVKRHGLGRALLDRLVSYGIERGYTALDGNILAENEAMLSLIRQAGFRAAGAPGREVAFRLCLP